MKGSLRCAPFSLAGTLSLYEVHQLIRSFIRFRAKYPWFLIQAVRNTAIVQLVRNCYGLKAGYYANAFRGMPCWNSSVSVVFLQMHSLCRSYSLLARTSDCCHQQRIFNKLRLRMACSRRGSPNQLILASLVELKI